MPLPVPPNFQSAKLLFASQLNALGASIPKRLTDLIPSPTGINQVLTSAKPSTSDTTNSYSYTWESASNESPVFTGPVTMGQDSNNYFVTHGGAVNQPPILQVTGSDINIGMNLQVSGSGFLTVQSNNSIGNLSILPCPSTSPSGNILLQATGSAAAVGIQLTPKGSAYVSLSKSPNTDDNSTNIATTAYVNNWFIKNGQNSTTGGVVGGGTGGTTGGGTGGTPDAQFGYGTFTPEFTTDSIATGQGNGNYWLAGNILFFNLIIPVVTVINNVGGVTITGLPIEVAGLVNPHPITNFSVVATGLAAPAILLATCINNTIIITSSTPFQQFALTSGNINSTTVFIINGIYPVDR